ncbi:MAG: peptidoglycan-binding domain-containing protein [Mycobacteriales bacterium]
MAAALGIVIVAGAVVFVVGGGSGEDGGADAVVGSVSTATTAIERRDLVEIETEDGTLGYADTRSVVNRLPGTVTWLPPVGNVVRADRVLYKVDDSPVILMSGRVPAYRALGPGVSAGADVRQLEQSLRATGYDPDRDIEIDRAWDGATTAAVKRWQQAHAFSRTGQIELGRLVFLPGARRVASTDATLGGPGGGAPPNAGGGADGRASESGPPSEGAAGTVLSTTSTRRLVTVDLDTTKSALAKQGARVTVELPSGRKVRGRISSVGKVATSTSSPDQSSESSSTSTATIEVTIRLFAARTALDQAPVSVRFERSRRKNVLAIPVTALLARPGGQFALQLVTAGKRRVVAVKPGLYTSGFVEIAGAGLRPGQRVTNAAVQ